MMKQTLILGICLGLFSGVWGQEEQAEKEQVSEHFRENARDELFWENENAKADEYKNGQWSKEEIMEFFWQNRNQQQVLKGRDPSEDDVGTGGGKSLTKEDMQRILEMLGVNPNKGVIFRTESIDKKEKESQDKIVYDESEFDPEKRVANGPSQYDSRIDIRELRADQPWQRKILASARGVGMIVEKQQLHAISDTIFQLDISTTLQQRYNLCADEAFLTQPVIGTGTAFLVDDDHMVTAAHVFERPLSEYVVIFGFEMINEVGGYSKLVTQSNIFQPVRITNAQQDLDVAVFALDRATTRPPLKLGNSTDFATGDPVFMLGHPSGLPLKCALNASLRGKSGFQYFHTTLDAFQGNSGSPVLSLETNEVIGVLVAGEVDFHWNGNCNRVKPCRIPYCEGEKVIRIEQVNLLPQ